MSAPVIGIIYAFATFIPSVCVTARRFHDVGKSGKWYFLLFVPIISLYCVYLLVKPSQHRGSETNARVEQSSLIQNGITAAETYATHISTVSYENCYKSKYQHISQSAQLDQYDLSTIEELAIRELQHYGKINAIKLVREKMGYSLYDAKVFVDNLELMLTKHPQMNIQTQPQTRVQDTPRPNDVSAVDGMDGHAFEHYCAQLLRKNKFVDVSVTPGSGDQGVDILATKDGIKYAIQCKNYASALGNTPIQEVSAGKVFYNCHVGVVLTNSTFTPKAKELAKATGVLLWDRKKLQELITSGNPASKATDHEVTAQDAKQSFEQTPVPYSTYGQQTSAQPTVVPTTSARTFDFAQPKVDNPPLAASFFTNRETSNIVVNIEGVQIYVHVGSASAVNLVLNNFGIGKDDDTPDDLTLLFDVEAKNGHGIPEDITIVCNAFSDNYKLATEHEYLYKREFYWKDSLEVYFDKKNIANRTTRIEIFCKRG